MHTTEQSSGQVNGRDTISGVAPHHPDIGHDLRTPGKGSEENPVSLDSAVISRKGGVFE
jgi:hypothetical protein